MFRAFDYTVTRQWVSISTPHPDPCATCEQIKKVKLNPFFFKAFQAMYFVQRNCKLHFIVYESLAITNDLLKI